MIMDYEKTANMFKAFCDTNRLQILSMLVNGEECSCNLLEELHIGQSTLSHHMKILSDSGLINGRKDGKWTYYTIDAAKLRYAQEVLEQLLPSEAAQQRKCNCN